MGSILLANVWSSTLDVDLTVLLRLGLSVLCGLAVGYNRAQHFAQPQTNRLRVHVLVGLSACLLVLAAGDQPDARSRAIQGIATGVGFLGAGEILVDRGGESFGGQHPRVHGLTSAASIWFTAALGVTVAASTPVLAITALLLALVVLSQHAKRPHV
ncbi:MAG: MgtC/SapB family protein [Vulcanococcus sp.]